jgi:thiamine monophosphate synthase
VTRHRGGARIIGHSISKDTEAKRASALNVDYVDSFILESDCAT